MWRGYSSSRILGYRCFREGDACGTARIFLIPRQGQHRLVGMGGDSEIAPAISTVVPAPPPPPSNTVSVDARPLQLRPLWVGLALTIAGFFVFALNAQSADMDMSRSLGELWAIPAFIYYFMVVHRVVRVLNAQPGWSGKYTPAAAVWKHFIPIYGIFFLYRWPEDVESYVNGRSGRKVRFAVLTFLGLLAGFLLRWFDSFVGLLVIMVSLYFLYVPLRRSLVVALPANEPAPAYNGTLGLR
jgi:hypothetical protein